MCVCVCACVCVCVCACVRACMCVCVPNVFLLLLVQGSIKFPSKSVKKSEILSCLHVLTVSLGLCVCVKFSLQTQRLFFRSALLWGIT